MRAAVSGCRPCRSARRRAAPPSDVHEGRGARRAVRARRRTSVSRAAPSRAGSERRSGSTSAASSSAPRRGHEQLERVDAARRRARRGGRAPRAAGRARAGSSSGAQARAEHDAPVRELEAVDAARSPRSADACRRSAPPASRGGAGARRARSRAAAGRRRASQRPTRSKTARGASARCAQHVLGRRGRRRPPPPRARPRAALAGARGVALDRGPLEDRVARLDGGVGERVRHQRRACRRCARARRRARASSPQVDAALRQRRARGAAAPSTSRWRSSRRALRGEQAQHARARARRRARGRRRRSARARARSSVEELLARCRRRRARRRRTIDAQPRVVRGPELARRPTRAARGSKSCSTSAKTHELVRGARRARRGARRESVGGQRRLEEASTSCSARSAFDVVAEQHAADLVAQRVAIAARRALARASARARSGAPSSPSASARRAARADRRLGERERAPRRAVARRPSRRARSRSSTSPAATCWPRRTRTSLHDAGDRRVRSRSPSSSLRAGRAAGRPRRGRPAATCDRDDHRRRAGAHLARASASRSGAARPSTSRRSAALGRVVAARAACGSPMREARGVRALLAQRRRRRRAPSRCDAVAPGAEREDLQPVAARRACVRSICWPVDGGHARRRDVASVSAKKLRRAACARALVGEDRRGDQRLDREAAPAPRAAAAKRSSQLGVDAAARGSVRRLEQRRAGSPCWSRRPRSRARSRASAQTRRARASSRVSPRGDHLGDQRVEVGGHRRCPAATPVSTRTRGPSAGSKRAMRPGAGQEAGVGILGADARLDRDAALARARARQRLAARDPDLQLHQVDAGRSPR